VCAIIEFPAKLHRIPKEMPVKRIRFAPETAGQSSAPISRNAGTYRIFLLSPANASSTRAELLLSESGKSLLAQRLRGQSATLGEIFTFISGLYFRGKLAYAEKFMNPPRVPGTVVITALAGLVSPNKVLTLDEFRKTAIGRVDASRSEYRIPLERDAALLRDHMGSRSEVVLLGSIATPKYVEPLLSVFGSKLMFPAEFVGRGDMSRGGLMLRCVRENVQLTYVPVAGAVRNGQRPPKLAKSVASSLSGEFSRRRVR
jgi:hypothetical protein